MVDYRRRCNMCGADFTEEDHELDAGCDMILPYGSAHDMAHLRLDLCCRCLDRLFDEYLIPNCKINPLVEIMDEDEVPWEEFED